MDPAYGDGKRQCSYASLTTCVCVVLDLWAGGFSSDEEGEQPSPELDLLASLIEKTGGGGGGERSSVAGEKGEKSGEKKETFEKALAKADDVSIMKGDQQFHFLFLLMRFDYIYAASPQI